MKRIYHAHTKWEEYPAGLWRKRPASEETDLLAKAIAFTGDAELYGTWMRRVTKEWLYSCEHNLTDVSQNRRAWLGHAACCMAIGAPEHVTRAAWWHLSQKQQDDANAQADAAILNWELRHEETQSCHGNQLVLTF
jgi:hypothetical protein